MLPCYDTLVESVCDNIALGSYGIFTTLGSTQSIYRKRLDDTDIQESISLLSRFPMTCFSRLPYTYNLAGDRALAWQRNDRVDTVMIRLVEEMQYEVETLNQLGGVSITQVGWFQNHTRGIIAASETLNRLRCKLNHTILLENQLDIRYALGCSFEDLRLVFDTVDSETQKHLGICIHIRNFFSNGLYDIRTEQGQKDLFERYDELFDKNIHAIVLEDSATEWESLTSQSIPLLKGYIWKNRSDELVSLIQICYNRHIPILTTSVNDFEIVRGIIEMFVD